MNAVFARPEKLTPGAIKEIKTSLDLIDRLRVRHGMKQKESERLSAETVNEIRRKVLRVPEPILKPGEKLKEQMGRKEEEIASEPEGKRKEE